jgi:hypothetical protein
MRISRPLPIAIGISLVLIGGVADAASTTCSTSTVCAEFINSSSGVAIHGEANTGIGMRGTSNGSTGFYGASRSGSPLFPGVEGESLNQTGADVAGGFGLTAATEAAPPAYGVLAYGSAVGAEAFTVNAGKVNSGASATISVTGSGVAGGDNGGAASDDGNAGVLGVSTHGAAMVGLASTSNVENGSFGTLPVGVLGDAEPERSNQEAVGVWGISDSIPLEADNPNTGVAVFTATPFAGVNYDLFALTGSNILFYVDSGGNMSATTLMTTKGSYARTTGSSGTARTLYAAHTTAPVTEDFGEGQVVNGRGYVRLDSALADVIDDRNAYHVFLTPEGDSNGLYVTQKSTTGFAVRESRGGRSTLAFEYRILAKPIDEDGKRLALAPPLPRGPRLDGHARPHNASRADPLDPFARLKAKLGPVGYARALKAARLVETSP